MARGKYNVYAAQCPTRQALDRIADKWTALIVDLLSQRTYRFGELRRSIEGISHKVLVQTLRSLERDGLVHRQPIASNPPTVEYSLTELGRTLVRPRVDPRLGRGAHRRTAGREGGVFARASDAEPAHTELDRTFLNSRSLQAATWWRVTARRLPMLPRPHQHQCTNPSVWTPLIINPMLSIFTMRPFTTLKISETYICGCFGSCG